jgi:hypothetical protein
MALDPAVEDQLETGQIVTLDLIRFDLPGKTVGYHMGGRPFTYNGLTYLPNRWLSMGEATGDLGVAVSSRTIVFSNVPVDDVNDAVANLDAYAYTNAPVIIAHLAGRPGTSEVLGILTSNIYEINEVRYEEGAAGENGERTLTIIIELEPPGRSARGSTAVMRSQQEHQFDNDETDTCLEHASIVQTIPVEWGQRSG